MRDTYGRIPRERERMNHKQKQTEVIILIDWNRICIEFINYQHCTEKEQENV